MKQIPIVCALASMLLWIATVQADALAVAVKPAPPFALPSEPGHFQGMAVDLFRVAAEDLGLRYRFVEVDSITGVFDGLASGEFQIGIGALSITAERLQKVDFTQPYYHSGLGIAVPKQRSSSLLAVLRGLIASGLLTLVGGLAALLFFVGLVVWWFERHRNAKQFSNDSKGIGSGFWWAAVTMTTVGYGDKSPVTLGGRIVATIWMFAAIIMISGFTGAIASSLTLLGLQGEVRGPGDLPKVTVGAVQGTTSATYLDEAHIRYRGFDTLQGGLQALARGELQAMVHDKPVLLYEATRDFQGQIEVLPGVFAEQNYGFALPLGNPLIHPLDQALLRALEDPAWQALRTQYLGDQSL